MLPETSNFCVGVAVPIPTLPRKKDEPLVFPVIAHPTVVLSECNKSITPLPVDETLNLMALLALVAVTTLITF